MEEEASVEMGRWSDIQVNSEVIITSKELPTFLSRWDVCSDASYRGKEIEQQAQDLSRFAASRSAN